MCVSGALVPASLTHSAPWAEPALESADLVVPKPSLRERPRERGLNRAIELAKGLAPVKTAHGLLLRIQDTPPKSALKRALRLRNLRDAYAVQPLRARELAGMRVVLVDDVMASGASMHAAARASHVTGMVLARADPPRSDSGDGA